MELRRAGKRSGQTKAENAGEGTDDRLDNFGCDDEAAGKFINTGEKVGIEKRLQEKTFEDFATLGNAPGHGIVAGGI